MNIESTIRPLAVICAAAAIVSIPLHSMELCLVAAIGMIGALVIEAVYKGLE